MKIERLVAFLYRIIRDDIVSGRIELHMNEIDKHNDYNYEFDYSNEDLEQYCRKLVKRLVKE
jgi:hypothetical protein